MTERPQLSLGRAGRVQISGRQNPRSGPRSLAAEVSLFDNGDGDPLACQFHGDRQADHAAAHHDDIFHPVFQLSVSRSIFRRSERRESGTWSPLRGDRFHTRRAGHPPGKHRPPAL